MLLVVMVVSSFRAMKAFLLMPDLQHVAYVSIQVLSFSPVSTDRVKKTGLWDRAIGVNIGDIVTVVARKPAA
jgi:hypothetical protein